MALSEIEHRVCRTIGLEQAALEADLAAHVAIPTGRNYKPGLDEYRALLVKRLSALGAKVSQADGAPRPAWLTFPTPAPGHEIDASSHEAPPPTVIARRPRPSAPVRILLAGHLDTVHDPQGPFQALACSDDRRTATGPGVVDMKGGILIAIAALEAIEQCAVDLSWTFLLNSDEETGSFHSFDALTAAAREHDVGIVLEPALPDGSLVTQRMGAGQFKVEVFGRAAHVGRDFQQGISAVTTLAEIIAQLAALGDPKRGLILNVGPLQGGQATNIVPDYAACWGNVRFADEHGAKFLEEKLAALRTSRKQMPRVVVHHALNRPAKPLIEPVRKLAEAARETACDLGQQLPFASTGGVCDGNILQAAGLPTLDTLGVRGGNLHRTDEFIELASLVERAQLLAVLLMRLGSGQIQVNR